MRHTVLHKEHEALGARMVDFHGWSLPIQYRGILHEHQHTRAAVSVFDCSHMGEFMLRGPRSIRAFERLVFNDMICLPKGRCRYTSILDVCGGIIDDVIAIKLSADELYVVTNATPIQKVARIMHRTCGGENLSSETAKIDVQGPQAHAVLVRLGLEAVSALGYFQAGRFGYRGEEIVVSRAGYTGELGYELFVPKNMAVELWQSLLAEPEIEAAGLGARDTLRLEMGYTLYGQDVDESHTTLEAGMERFIAWESEFNARDFLVKQREMGRYKVRTGIRSFDRRAPRPGHEVFHNGEPVGSVTSGTLGPSLGYGIGMAYVPLELATPGTALTVGPRDLPVETAAFPFYKEGSLRARTEVLAAAG